jgi:starch synthase
MGQNVAGSNKMRVAFFSSEVYPFAKTGGLADVAGALPLALAEQGLDVRIVMPQYAGIEPEEQFVDWGRTRLSDNVEVLFIRHDMFYKRDGLYGSAQGDYPDNLLRFSFLCKQGLFVLRELGFKADIYHSNDWQTALVPLLLKTKAVEDSFFKKARTVFTVHNLAFQGWAPMTKFPTLGLDDKYRGVLEAQGQINLMKGALLASHRVNTVSPTYALEIRMPGAGCGLEFVLQLIAPKLRGILNGIDYAVWNPATDTNLVENYSAKRIEGKDAEKAALLKEFGLRSGRGRMLMGMVSRLSEQKGMDILLPALEQILSRHSVIILGSGEERYHGALARLKERFPDTLAVVHGYNDALSHRIYAAADMFLMPSRFEPCGLSQLISFRYGTVPLVHATGGLRDTVIDYYASPAKGNGVVFTRYETASMLDAVKRAEKLYANKAAWGALRKRVCSLNFSWKKAAKQYIDMYESACSL